MSPLRFRICASADHRSHVIERKMLLHARTILPPTEASAIQSASERTLMSVTRRLLAVLLIAALSLAHATGASSAAGVGISPKASGGAGHAHSFANPDRHATSHHHAAADRDAAPHRRADIGHGSPNSVHQDDCGQHGHDCSGCAQHCSSGASLDSVDAGLLRLDTRLPRPLLNDRGSAQVGHGFDRPPRAI